MSEIRDDFQDEVMSHAGTFLPHLRLMPAADLQSLLEEVDIVNRHQPLRLQTMPVTAIHHWDERIVLTGAQIIALWVFALWVQSGELPENAGPLLERWPRLADVARSIPFAEPDR